MAHRPGRPRTPGVLLLDVEEAADVAQERARSWALVRGYDRLTQAIDSAFEGPAPDSGFLVIINKPHSLLLRVTWPWAPSRSQTMRGRGRPG
ncbi:hypothetical protein ET495_17390 (plasmid) [Xylanimonas allomyrinae]|uniref:Uncharacterized protein n=1 Tax=Xylanimonas allomyrinae TaxID=2509459 RepID=A0A4P6ERB1_9MICO|nr:hypothetical protein [Xylanimonas allomyrinae]QAY64995.1 hypothetical protein ET495_17390 [Xylanimonas allomyrinae]